MVQWSSSLVDNDLSTLLNATQQCMENNTYRQFNTNSYCTLEQIEYSTYIYFFYILYDGVITYLLPNCSILCLLLGIHMST